MERSKTQGNVCCDCQMAALLVLRHQQCLNLTFQSPNTPLAEENSKGERV